MWRGIYALEILLLLAFTLCLLVGLNKLDLHQWTEIGQFRSTDDNKNTSNIILLNVFEIPYTNGLQQSLFMVFCSKMTCNPQVVLLHHLPEMVVHGLNHLSTGVPEGDTTKHKILFKMI